MFVNDSFDELSFWRLLSSSVHAKIRRKEELFDRVTFFDEQ